jgi:hypothetical protein
MNSLHAHEKSIKNTEKVLLQASFRYSPAGNFQQITQNNLIINNVSSAVVPIEDMEILELTQLRNPRLHIFWAGIFRSHV